MILWLGMNGIDISVEKYNDVELVIVFRLEL